MLVHLSIRDLAIIDALELSLGPGMTALTGETGAGKSILIDAIGLLLGGRARADVIRTGAEEAEVAAQLSLSGRVLDEVRRRLEAEGLPPCEDGALLLRRVVSRAGRHKQFVNGTLATVAQLKEVAEPLVDITGQHAHQALLRSGVQRELLDAFGDHDALLDEVGRLYDEAHALAAERDRLSASEEEKLRRAEYLRFQVDEIRALDPRPGEVEALAEERARLMHAEKLKEAVARALDALVEGGEDALARVQVAAQALGKAGAHDARLAKLAGLLEEAAALIDEVGRELGRYGDAEEDPGRLEEVDERLDALRKVLRKHGGDIASVLSQAEQMERELEELEHAEERLAEVEKALKKKTAELIEAAGALSGKRRAAARIFASRVEEELQDLGMPKARLDMRVEPLPATADAIFVGGTGEARYALSRSGADRVEMFLAANPGEDAAPLSKVASGGELSRVLLAIKRVLLEKDPVPVTLFDEVDAGVGGAVGEAIGDKLRTIAEGRQVIVVTHLAQIAARAHHHLRVEKAEVNGRTRARIEPLEGEARLEEIARMIGGRTLTDTTRDHAAEMLAMASPSMSPANGARAPKKKRGRAPGRASAS